MMKITFNEIDNSNLVIADVADWPIGVGVEVGYAFAKGIRIICICPEVKSIASTVASIARRLIIYTDYEGLRSKLQSLDLRNVLNG